MKKLIRKTQKLVKGMPTAVVASILFHAGLFVLAGVLVIFTIARPKEVVFEPPPPVKIPKMPLKKLQVRMKKPSKPKASAKITAVVNRPDLHDIQFPDLASSGIGAGLGSGSEVVNFSNLLPLDDLEDVFGKEKSIGNDLAVTFYDTKRSRSGRLTVMDNEMAQTLLRDFLRNEWDTSAFSHIYRSPKKRYATCIVMPATMSHRAPAAFGERDAYPGCWIALYEGNLVHTEDIVFRFWVVAEDSMAIRVDKEYVLAAGFIGTGTDSDGDTRGDAVFEGAWTSSSLDSRKYIISNDRAVVGDWIELKAGEPRDLEIVLRDNHGFGFTAIVAVQVKGVEYERSSQGGPILPVFKTDDISRDLLDIIYSELSEKEMISLTNGPVFRDY